MGTPVKLILELKARRSSWNENCVQTYQTNAATSYTRSSADSCGRRVNCRHCIMPHFICRWPGGDVLLASVDSRQELDTILQERCEPGVCKVARYHGPLVLELKPDVPGVSRASAERFKPGPACPGFQPAWDTRQASGDVELLAADGSSQRAHKLVLQCRLPVLHGQPIAAHVEQVRLSCVPDMACLHSLVQFLYLDEVQQEAHLTPQLHIVALACGLQRLVELCEARFAQQLEVQLLSLQGLCEVQRDAVLDSFIGWCLYSEQLQREKLRQLCVHALARHAAAAQSRPTWSSLSKATASLVWLITASTAPPLVHRQIALDGSAVLPAPQNPAPGIAAASGPTVSVDAEAFAAAGGRLTTTEWQHLQKFRAAVTQSLHTPEASPLVLEQQQLQHSSFAAAAQPHMAFSVKQPVLGPHKRLMDSVCRFAFPATHGLLGAGWQLAAQPLQTLAAAPVSSSGAGPVASAATPRPAGAVPAAAVAGPAAVNLETVAATAGVASAASPAAEVARQPAAAAMEASNAPAPRESVVDTASVAPLVPVPVPDAQPLLELIAAATAAGPEVPGALVSNISSLSASAAAAVAAAALAPREHTDHSNSSCQQPLPRIATALMAEQDGIRVSGSGSSNHLQQPDSPADPSTSNNTSPVQAGNATPRAERQALSAGRYLLRSRNQSGSSAGGRRSSHLRSESLPHSWGSGVSPGTSLEAQPALQQGQEQQQQLYQLGPAAAALPLPVLRRLQGDDGSGCWGSGTISLQTSLPGSPLRGNFAELQAALRRQQQQYVQQGQQQSALQGLLQPATPTDPQHRLAQQQQQRWHQQVESLQMAAGGQQQSEHLHAAGGFAIISSSGQQQQHQQQGQQQPHQVLQEALRSVAPVAPGAHAAPAVGSSSGHESTAPVLLEGAAQGHHSRLLDLPAACIPGAAAGGGLHATACGEVCQRAPAPWTASIPHQAAAASALTAGDPAAIVGAPEAVHRPPSYDPLAALHRALVEDFVLYEEASAARQHVVGIVVSIEHGDQATGQRLLAPACAELIAATAPAGVPNRLGLSSNHAAAAATDRAAAAAVRATNYMKVAKGIGKLLGMASVSRAAQEPLPAQLQRRQQQLFRALQRIGTQLPGLTRLLAAYNVPFAMPAAAGTASEAVPMGGVVLSMPPVSPGPFAAQVRQPGMMPTSGAEAAGAVADSEQELRSLDLEAALGELLSLPELAQGMPVLLTQQQYQQRQLQVKQLASRAAAMLAARDESDESGLVAAESAAATAPPPSAGPGPAAGQTDTAALVGSDAAGTPAAASAGNRDFQAGLLFSSILASLGAAAVAPASGPSAQTAAVPAARPTSAHLQGRLGAGIGHLGALGNVAASLEPGAAAGSVLPSMLHTGPLGLLGAGGAPGPADGLMAAAMGSAMHMGPAGGPPGVLTPTGMGALLAGGLLAEGGVAGDSIVEDMAADMLVYGAPGGRRITCNGMLELCAALARPVSDHGASPSTQQQPQAQEVAADAEPKFASVQDGERIPAGLTGHKRRRSSSGIEHGHSESKR